MMKNCLRESKAYFYFVSFRLVHSRRREQYRARNLYERRPSYNNNYDPASRNVYRKVQELGEDEYPFEEMEDEIWKAERHFIDSSEEEERKSLKRLILAKKERKKLGLNEPNILTWAARVQIRFLHAQDPYKWTPEVLADSFPVSKYAIINILKAKWLPEDEESIQRHDKKVYQNWLKLQADLEKQKESVPRLEDRKVIDARLSKIINAAGIPGLPVPCSDEIVLTRKKLIEKLHPKVKGQFSTILSDYKAQFGQRDRESISTTERSENIALPIGDEESVQLLKSISLRNEKKGKEEITDNEDEGLPERQTDHENDMKIAELHPENNSETEIRPVSKLSRRQRRLKEISVNKNNLEELQMLGTEKIS